MIEASRSPADIRRGRELARMKLIATGLLALMAAVFVAASLGQARWPALAPALGYVRAFSEAGMVGACADWFAVTALFRRPLGLPIPHTAIIPRNKDRIGAALGGFIADNFLTAAVLQDKLRALDAARWGGAWLQRPANARGLAARLAKVLPQVVSAIPRGALGDVAAQALLAAARATSAAPLAGRALDRLRRDGHADRLIAWAVAEAAKYLTAHRTEIGDLVVARPGWTRWFDRMLVGRVLEALTRTLEAMHAPDHRLRRVLRATLDRLSRRLRSDPDLQARVDAMKDGLLAHPALALQIEGLKSALDARVLHAIVADEAGLAVRLEAVIRSFGGWLAENAAARERLNAWAREVATGVIAPRRREIGRFVAEVVAGWEADSVTDKLELQVGKDLQYIRINGTLVGGLVGLLIHAASRAAGL